LGKGRNRDFEIVGEYGMGHNGIGEELASGAMKNGGIQGWLYSTASIAQYIAKKALEGRQHKMHNLFLASSC